MTWAARLGRVQFFRNRGAWYVETIRAWITPAAASGAVAKFLGLQSRWSVAIAVALPLLVESFGFLIGRWLYHQGGVEADYSMALAKDEYKVRSLELLEAIRARLADPAQ